MLVKNFALNLSACLSGIPFSFDELIIETKNLFEKEGILGFLKALIALIDSFVVLHFINNNSTSKCCEATALVRSGKKSKKLSTSLGKLDFEWTRVKCKNCGKIYNPLKEFLGLEKHQTKSSELEKTCLEIVSLESYRRATRTICDLKPVHFNHRTLHRWVMMTEADEIKLKHSDLNVILADGTKYKKFVSKKKEERKNILLEKLGKPKEEISKRGEIRIVTAIMTNGDVIPLGAWSSEAWKTIGNMIYKVNNPDKRLAPKKVANILLADGEIAIDRGLGKLVNHKQRCLWHIPHDLKPLMKYQDKATDEDTKLALDQVSSIFQIEIPEKDFEKVETQDFVEINEKIKCCEMQMKILSDFLSFKGYSQAATYITNAKDDMFTYLR